jgi:hypothetical protein
MDNAEVYELSLDDTGLHPEKVFNDFYESKDQHFVLSKGSTIHIASPSRRQGKSSFGHQ